MKKTKKLVLSLISVLLSMTFSFVSNALLYKGDVNDDDLVTGYDARVILQIAAQMKPYPEDLKIVDMNNDGKVSAMDARIVLQIAAGLKDMEELQSATVLDSGKCGDTLNWELLSNGTLHIFGTGRMYDYVKYVEPSPWYKYRDEPYISEDGKTILNSNGTSYMSTKDYYANNPNNYKIKRIIIDEGVTYIGDWAFYRVCVERLTIPEGVEETGIFCFRYSPTLKMITLPDSLKILDDFAISRNYELETIYFGNGLEKIGTGGLKDNTKLQTVILPDSCVSINKQLSPAYTGAKIDYSVTGLMENNISLKTVDFGSVVDIPQRTCLGTAVENVTIPNTVTSIGEYAFYNCSSLKTVVFEENSVCKSIGDNAFAQCMSLISVTGGTALEEFGRNAFNGSTETLIEFEFSDANRDFSNALFYNSSIEYAKIGPSVTIIPKSMFSNSKIKILCISENVMEIQAGALYSCSNLENIYYNGTSDEWKMIVKAIDWTNAVTTKNCTIHFNDGTSAQLSTVM